MARLHDFSTYYNLAAESTNRKCGGRAYAVVVVEIGLQAPLGPRHD